MKIRNRKGSVTVFLMVFFVSLVLGLQIFIHQSEKLAVKGICESVNSVIAQSLLGEYDLHLRERYGIFGFPGPESEINRKCSFYAKEAFRGKSKIHFEKGNCKVAEYSLCNTALFKKQIIEESKSETLKHPVTIKEKEEMQEESSGEQKEGFIKNQAVLYYLPSNGTEKKFFTGNLGSLMKKGSLKEVLEHAGDRALILNYIQHYFKSAHGETNPGKTFFRYEQEYFVCGKFSDRENRKGIRNRIISLREVSNYGFLRKDPEKSAMVLAAAELLTPGPAAAATAEGLFASWALAESVNDYKLLVNGHKVPAVKTPDMWAVDLESVINNEEKGCIFTGKDRGESYEDYISVFLSAMDEHLLLLRIMDLIQINMKYLYYDDFLLADYYGGITAGFTVNGVDYELDKEY